MPPSPTRPRLLRLLVESWLSNTARRTVPESSAVAAAVLWLASLTSAPSNTPGSPREGSTLAASTVVTNARLASGWIFSFLFFNFCCIFGFSSILFLPYFSLFVFFFLSLLFRGGGGGGFWFWFSIYSCFFVLFWDLRSVVFSFLLGFCKTKKLSLFSPFLFSFLFFTLFLGSVLFVPS